MPSLRSDLPLPLAPAALRRLSASRADGLSTGQYRTVVALIVAVHVAAVWGALQVPAVRATVLDAAPIFVELLAPAAPPAPPLPAPPPPVMKPPPKSPPPTVVTAPPAPAPAPFVAPPAPEVPPPPVPQPVAIEAPVAPPAPPAPPKLIPASAVQYLVRPVPEYPRQSIRQGETGEVTVRVYIDEAGVPSSMVVHQSSGHPRLDEAALAAVRQARFKPYMQNGVATAGWARIPIPFELEK